MRNNFLSELILHYFGHIPTEDQSFLITKILSFLSLPSSDVLFLLKGFAGTGKTSLLGALVKSLQEINYRVVLLAPTGRAAKVFSTYAGTKSYTIHKKIYRQKRFTGEMTGFLLMENLHKDTLFIVDEASMIGNSSAGDEVFGSGRLLDDLIEYVYTGENCRLMLVGDTAQLPPVMQPSSPALDEEILKGYGLLLEEGTLRQVVRQTESSGILFNATMLRLALTENGTSLFPKLHTVGFSDIRSLEGDDLIEMLSSCYSGSGLEETIVIARSNKRANVYNQGIRNRILYREEEISTGDLLIVTKNNYFWSEQSEDFDFIANGEIVEVLRVRRRYELYGLRFADLLVRFRDYDLELEVKVLLDTLISETASIPKEVSDLLFRSVWDDYPDIPSKRERIKKIKEDPHFNALAVKYAYAVTCHKAQGGQWENVFVDIGFITKEFLGDDFYRWLYTAITRATQHLYIVNLPKEMFA
ncbi:MAG: AAA family ATPase [Bacteroidales bacterium]|nr:AAA family ATPase [Bacteroidales bacterium]